jgi:hypothetical protein
MLMRGGRRNERKGGGGRGGGGRGETMFVGFDELTLFIL